jgi:hypothetical protein
VLEGPQRPNRRFLPFAFSAKGVAFTFSLGAPPEGHFHRHWSALKARFILLGIHAQRARAPIVNLPFESRFQR